MARLILISFEQKLEEKKLDVEFECAKDKMIVYADRDAIYQILYNICDNAVKFSREGGKYKISILAKERKVYVSVFNEGIGIPENELPVRLRALLQERQEPRTRQDRASVSVSSSRRR